MTALGTGSSSRSRTQPEMVIFSSGSSNEYMWSYPRASPRLLLKYPLSPCPKVIPKSSAEEFMGCPMFTTLQPPLFFSSARKISRPPNPAWPSEAKYSTESVRTYGNTSSPGVLIHSPRFSRLPARSFRFIRQISLPPLPPGMSLVKYNHVPSGLTAG